MRIVAIASCKNGTAKAKFAAESLENAAEDSEHDLEIEVRGAQDTENVLQKEKVRKADTAVIASEATENPFEDLPAVVSSLRSAINEPEKLVQKAEEIRDKDVEEINYDPAEGSDKFLSRIMNRFRSG
jgi:fructose-specific phosphotransferase system component IIB